MSIAKILRLDARALTWLSVAVLMTASLLPALLTNTRVDAAQVSSRSITLGTSVADAETTYRIQFTVPDNGVEDVGSFRVEFCNNNPLPNEACTNTAVGDDVPQVDTNAGTIATLNGAPTFNAQAISMTAPSISDYYLDFTLAAVTDIGSGTVFDVTVNDVDNPDNTTSGENNDPFYARVYVYSTTTPDAAANPMPTTTQTNDGGLAVSTAEQLTITARVQEILEFCIGNDQAVPVNCAAMGNVATVDLGVLDSNSVNRATTQSVASQGSAMIRTNALTGVTLNYFTEQDTTSGKLKVIGAACNGVLTTDQCINSTGTTQTVIAAGTESFGMCAFNVDRTGSVTTNLTLDGEYDGACDNTATNGYAWDDTGTVDTIATSVGNGGVVDDEMIELDFSGTASITTPTGVYNVTATFIATPIF